MNSPITPGYRNGGTEVALGIECAYLPQLRSLPRPANLRSGIGLATYGLTNTKLVLGAASFFAVLLLGFAAGAALR